MPNVETTYFQLWSWASNLWLVDVDSPWIVFSPMPRVEAQRATFRFAYLFLCFLVHFCTSCLIWLFTMWVLKFPVFSRETAGSSRCPRPAASFSARKNLYEGISCRALDDVTVGAGRANPKCMGSPLGAQAATLRHGSWKQPWPGGISSSGTSALLLEVFRLIESGLPDCQEWSSSEINPLWTLITPTNIFSPTPRLVFDWLTGNDGLAQLIHKKGHRHPACFAFLSEFWIYFSSFGLWIVPYIAGNQSLEWVSYESHLEVFELLFKWHAQTLLNVNI